MRTIALAKCRSSSFMIRENYRHDHKMITLRSQRTAYNYETGTMYKRTQPWFRSLRTLNTWSKRVCNVERKARYAWCRHAEKKPELKYCRCRALRDGSFREYKNANTFWKHGEKMTILVVMRLTRENKVHPLASSKCWIWISCCAVAEAAKVYFSCVLIERAL